MGFGGEKKVFDHHTRTLVCQDALDEWAKVNQERICFENPSWKEAIFSFLDAPMDSLFRFGSSGAEMVAQVFASQFFLKAKKEGKNQFITTVAEEVYVYQLLKQYEELGVVVKIAPLDSLGRVDLKALSSLITPRTALVSLSVANGLTGVIQPVEEIEKLVKEKEISLHFDLSWLLGKSFFSFQNSLADYITFSGMGIHSIPSSGALLVKKEAPLISEIKGMNASFAPLAALARAIQLVAFSQEMAPFEMARLKNLLQELLLEKIEGLQILLSDTQKLPNTTLLSFPRIEKETLAYYLGKKGIFTNASGSYFPDLTKLLSYAHISGESALSFSISRMTTEEEIVSAVEEIVQTVQELQKLSEALFI